MNGSLEKAAIAIFVAGVLDSMDGRIARMTNTQSAFGVQYDSLSDLVAFGVAPSVLVFKFCLVQLGNFGSPGFAGGTRIASAVVPLPGAVWMFSSALSILCWIRRRTAARPGHVETSYADTPRKPSDDAHPSPISPAGHCFTDDRNWADCAGRALPRCI